MDSNNEHPNFKAEQEAVRALNIMRVDQIAKDCADYGVEFDVAHLRKLTDYAPENDELTRLADSIKRRDYFSSVRAMAKDIEDEVRTSFADDVPADEDVVREAIDERLHEAVDGSQWVIYTRQALDVLRYSEHDSAYADEFGTDGIVTDGCVDWSRLAFWALLSDVADYIDTDKLVDELCSEPEGSGVEGKG